MQKYKRSQKVAASIHSLSMQMQRSSLNSRGDRYLGHSSRHTQVPVPATSVS